MKRLGLNLTVAVLCFMAGSLAARDWGFVKTHSKSGSRGADARQRVCHAQDAGEGRTGWPYSPIRRVDFLNFTYRNDKAPLYPLALREFTLVDRKFEDEQQRFIYGRPGDISYADLTGDGEEEAIIKLVGVNKPSGAGHFVYVYTMERGEPKFLWLFQTYGPTLDDVGGINELYATGSHLVMGIYGRNRLKPDGSTIELTKRCGECLEDYTSARFVWDGERFRVVQFEVISLDGVRD